MSFQFPQPWPSAQGHTWPWNHRQVHLEVCRRVGVSLHSAPLVANSAEARQLQGHPQANGADLSVVVVFFSVRER